MILELRKEIKRRHLYENRSGEEPVEILVYDEVFYQADDLTVRTRPDTGIDSLKAPLDLDPSQTTAERIKRQMKRIRERMIL